MTLETEKALKDSIAHWERMRDNKRYEIHEYPSASDCALCKLFCFGKSYSCGGCPVMKKTGLRLCRNTPFQKAFLEFHGGTDERWIVAANEEIEFLKSLLPEKT